MYLFTGYGIEIIMSNNYTDPTIRHKQIIKDIQNILRLPDKILDWLDIDTECKDYTDEFKFYTESSISSITVRILLVR